MGDLTSQPTGSVERRPVFSGVPMPRLSKKAVRKARRKAYGATSAQPGPAAAAAKDETRVRRG